MTIETRIGYATATDIFVRGRNLATELIPQCDFVDMLCLCILGRLPEPGFKRMLNVLLVTATDHGFTPISIAGRLTLLGAPESLQGAVAAGLLGAGNRYLGVTQNVARMLREASAGLAADSPTEMFEQRAQALVAGYRDRGEHIPGLGHPIHAGGDPRVPALRQVSREHGSYGTCWRLLDALEAANAARSGKALPINGAGAMGAIAADLGLAPDVARGLALVGRAAGLVAHLVEEAASPSGPAIWAAVLQAEAAAKPSAEPPAPLPPARDAQRS